MYWKQLCTLVVALCYVSTVYSSRPLMPPALWCFNEQLAADWGVEGACKQYSKEAYGKKINITFLYESLCPGCHAVITDSNLPTLQAIANFEFIPFGNANLSTNPISCQHGHKECVGNAIQSCALRYLPTADSKLKFVQCFETSYYNSQSNPDGTIAKCTAQAGGSSGIANQIKRCYPGDEGQKLQRIAGQRTHSVQPDPYQASPWILVNGMSINRAQFLAGDLAGSLCHLYLGPIPSPANELCPYII